MRQLLIFLVLLSSSAAEDKPPALPVGVIIPLTGPAASMGESFEGAMRVYPLPNLSLRLEDDQCDAKRALAAYQKLHGQGVRVFYVACSGSILALAPYMKSRGELIVTSYSGSAAVRKTGPEVIRFNPDAVSVAEAMAQLFERNPEYQNIRRVALLHEEQDYANSLAGLLRERLGSRITLEETYLSTQPSFKTQLTKLEHTDVQLVLYIPVSDAATAIMLKEMKALAWSKPLLGDVNLCDYPLQAADFGLKGACFSARLATKGFEEFDKKYRDVVGHPSEFPFYDAIGADIFSVLDSFAAEHPQAGVPDLIKHIIAGVSGPASSYTFSPNGEVTNGDDYLKLRALEHRE